MYYTARIHLNNSTKVVNTRKSDGLRLIMRPWYMERAWFQSLLNYKNKPKKGQYKPDIFRGYTK